MNTPIILIILTATIVAAGIFAFIPVERASAPATVTQFHNIFDQSDHGLVDVASGEKGFCGSTKEPWILDISAAGDSDGGSVTLTFNDGDSITYPIPAGGSFSAQFNFGGVPGVDNVVRISGSGIPSMVVSALATENSVDPFDENDNGVLDSPPTEEKDNYCVVDPSEMNVEEGASATNTFGEGNTIIGVD